MNLDKYPLVSMCMSAYNHENYVQEAIQSVIDQDYKNIELIIINDGSSDSTHERIESLKFKCENRFIRFVYINRFNKGLTPTLNDLLRISKGKYFMCIASDDTQVKNRVSTLVNFMQNTNYFGCYSAYRDIDIYGNVIAEFKGNNHELDFVTILLRMFEVGYISFIFQKDIFLSIGGFNENVIVEDWELVLRITHLGLKVYFISQILYNHRLHNTNITFNSKLMSDEIFKILGFYKNHYLYEKSLFHLKVKYKLFTQVEIEKFKKFVNLKIQEKNLLNKNYKYLIYGQGTFGEIIRVVIKEQFVGFIDKETKKINFEFDYIIISVLAREEPIKIHLINKFNINNSKLICL